VTLRVKDEFEFTARSFRRASPMHGLSHPGITPALRVSAGARG